MVWFLAPIGWWAGMTIRRKVTVVAGVIVVSYFDEAGNKIGEWLGEGAVEAAEGALDAAGATIIDVAEEVGETTLNVIKGVGAAVIEGADNAFLLVKKRLQGHEPEVIAAITASLLVILVGLFLWSEVKRGPGGGTMALVVRRE